VRKPSDTLLPSGHSMPSNDVRIHPEPAGGDTGVFTDAHNFLERAGNEVETLKRELTMSDEARKAEVEQLKTDLAHERLLRRNALNELRYEFDEFVHKRIDEVITT